MQPLSPSTGLTITNPLVLYRALLATKRIDPDPAQHRLALHLQKLYHQLKDYEPEIEYSRRLNQISRSLIAQCGSRIKEDEATNRETDRKGVFSAFRTQKEDRDVLALTRRLTNHESAIRLESPKGLLLYGEVGTGKSMLVDILADSLPNRKKRRWHFNTFMLETFSKLETLRRNRLGRPMPTNGGEDMEEHSLLWLARDMISTSPIMFLDEFQLPDRVASKILSNLLTNFFHLGGVLIATSNRMPEELANASGVEFAPPPSSRLGLFGNRWGLLGSRNSGGRSEDMFSGKGDFAAFLEVLRARCEIHDMESRKDFRRREVEEQESTGVYDNPTGLAMEHEVGYQGLEPMAAGNWGLGYEQSLNTKSQSDSSKTKPKTLKPVLPKNYFITPSILSSEEVASAANQAWESTLLQAIQASPNLSSSLSSIPWQPLTLRVYGRTLLIPRTFSGTAIFTFPELCSTPLGPADYITIASTFHTLIITDIPILTHLEKNEARRLITLLDALYEARVKLLIRAAAGPDDIFFPETKLLSSSTSEKKETDPITSETFAEIYQDTTSPFRPNISSYTASLPSYTASPLPSNPNNPNPNPTTRSILADEDSDFGPVYGTGRGFPSNPSTSDTSSISSRGSLPRGPSDGAPGAGNEIGRVMGPDFGQVGMYTGEDEKFAFKRARSRLWEMCGGRWWGREDGWRPLGRETRRWEGAELGGATVGDVASSGSEVIEDEVVSEVGKVKEHGQAEADGIFKHNASPFRTSTEAPPKIGWTHAWGMMRWGRKAGVWGRGVEGLEERRKRDGK